MTIDAEDQMLKNALSYWCVFFKRPGGAHSGRHIEYMFEPCGKCCLLFNMSRQIRLVLKIPQTVGPFSEPRQCSMIAVTVRNGPHFMDKIDMYEFEQKY